MSLLIFTQKIDKEDELLGFFHNWVKSLSNNFSSIKVICLEKGVCDLPENVEVFSLGKEKLKYNFFNKIFYVFNFYRLIFRLKDKYDSVFVHMNEEYVLLGGFFWKIWNKKIYLWRNHPDSTIFTDLAVFLSNKVFCTSKYSYTAKFSKTKLMPVGIDTDLFNNKNTPSFDERKGKILFIGRISKIKNIHILIDALNILNKKSVQFKADIYGDPIDHEYFSKLKKLVSEAELGDKVTFFQGVPNYKTPEIYKNYEIFVNLTKEGSFDKTIFESGAVGCLPIALNKSILDIDSLLNIKSLDENEVANSIEKLKELPVEDKNKISNTLIKYILENHSLNVLIKKIIEDIR